jgi:hypothetical protein
MLASFPRTSAHHAHSLTADNNSEVVVKARASLLKTLTRFDRCSKMYLARIETDSMWTLNSGDKDELAQTSRQIARVHLNMMKLSRELVSVSRQIRALVLGKKHCLAMPAPVNRNNHPTNGFKAKGTHAGPCSAFAAISTENGAVVVRVLKDKSGVWPQKEYGRFETWTQAQGFATMLNQRYGIDPVEAQHIVVSASLAAARSRKQKS